MNPESPPLQRERTRKPWLLLLCLLLLFGAVVALFLLGSFRLDGATPWEQFLAAIGVRPLMGEHERRTRHEIT